MNKQEITSISCATCNGKLVINESEETTVCPYCGSAYSTDGLLLQNGGKSRVELSKHRTELERMKFQHEKEKQEDTRKLADKFKKGKLFKFLIFCIIISGFSIMGSFNGGGILQAFIAIVQIALYVVALLMGLQIIEEKKPGLHVVLVIVALLLIFPYISFNNTASSSSPSEVIKWEDMQLASVIPKLEGKKGEIYLNTSDSLSIDIHDIDETAYIAYVEECIVAGFTIDQEQSSVFEAFNQDGHKIQLHNYASNEIMHVQVYAPVEVSQMVWPTSELVALIPTPLSSVGKIYFESSDTFDVLVAQTPYEEYQNYVQKCSENGFNIDYEKTHDLYKASNDTGAVLKLTYQGFDMMEVNLEMIEIEVQSTTAESEVVQETTSSIVEASYEWKQFLIDYEAWVDEYIIFMKKYEENPTDLSLISDYTILMAEMIEWAESADNMQADLSDSDLVAYLETMTRIATKLNDAIYSTD